MEATAIFINNGSSEKHLQDHISELPNDILIRIMQLTSPLDACRLAAVNTTFQSVAESDELWTHFFPSDLSSIISGAEMDVHQHLPLVKKELYLYLCRNLVRFDDGLKSFSLDFQSGAKKIMLHEGSLKIRDESDAQRITLSTLATGIISFKDLSPETNYAAYLLFTGTPYDQYVNHDDLYFSTVAWAECANFHNLKTIRLKIWQESQMRDGGRWEIDSIKFNTCFEGHDQRLHIFFIYAFYVGGGFHFEGIEIRPTD